MSNPRLSDEVKQQVVVSALAAVSTLPPSDVPHDELVRQKVAEFYMAAMDATNEKSRIGRVMANLDESIPLVATIVGVKRDERNGRGIIGFRADRPGQTANEDGVETINTEPEYFAEGAAMIARARELKGHRVVIWKQVEQFESGGITKKGKVCRYLTDLGVPKDGQEG